MWILYFTAELFLKKSLNIQLKIIKYVTNYWSKDIYAIDSGSRLKNMKNELLMIILILIWLTLINDYDNITNIPFSLPD